MTLHRFLFEGRKGERLDKALSELLGDGVSREKIKKLIVAGLCMLDEKPCQDPSRKITPGQIVTLDVPEEQTHLEPEQGDVHILWQDRHLMVVDKPAGLTVHPAPSCPHGTLIQRLLAINPQLREHGGWRPGIVHRLDKDTSGLLIVAPDEATRLSLSRAFADRLVDKSYLALVSGVPDAEGECTEPLGRHPTLKTRMAVVPGGRNARTAWRVLYADPAAAFSLLAIRLYTGRTHQIRVHMAHLGHPLLGDATYAPRPVAARAPRQMLHAWKLSFIHPDTGEAMSFNCPPPADMTACFQRETSHTLRVVITGLPGCGKSRLTRVMAEEGWPTWSADEAVRLSYEPGGEGWAALNHRYRGAFTPKGKAVDKTALAEAIRRTPGMREEIEALIHPLVNQSLIDFWDQAEAQACPLAFAEVPLWLENGGTRPKHGPDFGSVMLIGVDCPRELRHFRLRNFRHWAEAMIEAADSWQWPEQKKMAACDRVIDNSGDEPTLIVQGRKLIQDLLECRVRQSPDLNALLKTGV